MKILVNTWGLKTQMIIKQDGIKYNQWNPNTGERWSCVFLNLSMFCRGGSRTPSTYKMGIFATIVIAPSHWLLSQNQ